MPSGDSLFSKICSFMSIWKNPTDIAKFKTIFSYFRRFLFSVAHLFPIQKKSSLPAKSLIRDQLKYLHESVTHDIPLLEKFIASYEPIPHNTFKNVTLANNQNNYKSESAKHIYNDIYFRSKSELNFAQMLSSYSIDFCYEPAPTL